MKAKAKKQRLPKDFDQLLENGSDLETLQKVFESCDLNARGGYSKGTALMNWRSPEPLIRWLVAQGADLAAVDTYGKTALHHFSGTYRPGLEVLLELGADVHATTPDLRTALHEAVDAKQSKNVTLLLCAGAEVNSEDREGRTPLERGLATCSNADLEPAAHPAGGSAVSTLTVLHCGAARFRPDLVRVTAYSGAMARLVFKVRVRLFPVDAE